MSASFLTLSYSIFPLLPAVYGGGAYLVRRPVARRALWLSGLLIAASMVGFTTVATRHALASISVARLLAATAVLYGVPMVVALATVDLLRRNRVPRLLGIFIVLCVSMASLLVVGYASAALLGLVEAVA